MSYDEGNRELPDDVLSEIGQQLLNTTVPLTSMGTSAVENARRKQEEGPDFRVVNLQMVLLVSVAKLFEIEAAANASPRAIDIARIFGVMDYAALKACTKMVMIAAKSGDRGSDWAAYTAPADTIQLMNLVEVPEADAIRRTFQYGDKLLQGTAESLFPIFVQLGYTYRR